MHLILLTFTFLVQNQIYSINNYFEGDTLVVWAEGGLSIRDTNSITGKRIGVIPYGEKVISHSKKKYRYGEEKINLTSAFQENEELKYLGLTLIGQWAKISYGDKIGYVFDGYLSKFSAPILKENGKSERLREYLYREFKLLNQEKSSGKNWIKEEIYFGKGISILNIGTKTAYSRFILPDFSHEEIVLFIKNSKLTNEYGAPKLIENKYLENENIRILKFKYDREGDGQITIKILHQMVILESDASC